MLIRCVYVFFVQLIQALRRRRRLRLGLWQRQGQAGVGDSVQRANEKKAMLKGRE